MKTKFPNVSPVSPKAIFSPNWSFRFFVSQNWKPHTNDNDDGTVAGAVMAQTSVGGARDGSAKKKAAEKEFLVCLARIIIYGKTLGIVPLNPCLEIAGIYDENNPQEDFSPKSWLAKRNIDLLKLTLQNVHGFITVGHPKGVGGAPMPRESPALWGDLLVVSCNHHHPLIGNNCLPDAPV